MTNGNKSDKEVLSFLQLNLKMKKSSISKVTKKNQIVLVQKDDNLYKNNNPCNNNFINYF